MYFRQLLLSPIERNLVLEELRVRRLQVIEEDISSSMTSNLDDQINSRLLKFADDTKIYFKVNSPQNIERLREDLCKLVLVKGMADAIQH